MADVRAVRFRVLSLRPISEHGICVALLPRFFQVGNLQDVLRRSSILGIVTMGHVLVLLTAGLDLSVGAVIGVTTVAIAESTAPGGPGLAVGLLVMVLIGIGVGATYGLLVTARRVPPFVATFGMFVVLEGARLAYTGGTVSGTVPDGLRELGRGTLLGVPWPTLALVGLVVGLTVFMEQRRRGRELVMLGANERMARLSGIPSGPKTRASRSDPVLVDESTEDRPPRDPVSTLFWELLPVSLIRRSTQSDGSVGSMGVVMLDVLAQDPLQVSSPQHQRPVGALGAHRTHRSA